MEVPAGQEQIYGIVAGKPLADAPRTLHIDDMVEKPAPGTAPSRPRDRRALRAAARRSGRSWRSTKPGKGGEIQLTDGLKELAQRGAGCYGLTVDGTRHDAGDKLGYLGANLAWALKRRRSAAGPVGADAPPRRRSAVVVIARVAVFAPIERAFDYRVPPARLTVGVGARVWAPFGGRTLEGVVRGASIRPTPSPTPSR